VPEGVDNTLLLHAAAARAMSTSAADYIAPDPDEFYEAGTDAVEEFTLEGESIESFTSMSGDAKPILNPLDSALWAGQIRFINKTIANLLVVAVAQKDTRALYDIECALTGPQGLGLTVALRNLPQTFPQMHVIFRLCTDPEPFIMTLDVPNGAEGFWYLWFAVVGDQLHFAGRGFSQKRRNVKFSALGCAEGRF
jgi:hypothetical protein